MIPSLKKKTHFQLKYIINVLEGRSLFGSECIYTCTCKSNSCHTKVLLVRQIVNGMIKSNYRCLHLMLGINLKLFQVIIS